MGIGVGGILGAGVFAIVSAAFDDNLVDFAWRIPFWLGGTLVLIGLYARLKAPAAVTAPLTKPVPAPLAAALRQRPRQLLLCTGIAFGYCTIAYIGSTFFLTYATQVGFGSTDALMFDLALSVAIVLSAPLFGYLSDRLGRRTVMAFGAVAMALGLFVFFSLVGMKSFAIALCAYSLTGLLMGATQGPIPAFLGEQFPRSMRYSGISASYQIGAALGGGTASSIATAILILTDHDPLGVALYGAGALALVAVCSLMLRETSRLSMAQIDEEAPGHVASVAVGNQ